MHMDDHMDHMDDDTSTTAADDTDSMMSHGSSDMSHTMSSTFFLEKSGFFLLFDDFSISSNSDFSIAVVCTGIFGMMATWGVHVSLYQKV